MSICATPLRCLVLSMTAGVVWRQDYLPRAVQDAFLTTVANFVLQPWREAMREALTDASQGGSQVPATWPSLLHRQHLDVTHDLPVGL